MIPHNFWLISLLVCFPRFVGQWRLPIWVKRKLYRLQCDFSLPTLPWRRSQNSRCSHLSVKHYLLTLRRRWGADCLFQPGFRLRCHLPYHLWLMLSRLVFSPAYRGNNGIRHCVPYLRNTFVFRFPSEKWSLNLVHLSYIVFLSLRNWPASTTVLFFVTYKW